MLNPVHMLRQPLLALKGFRLVNTPAMNETDVATQAVNADTLGKRLALAMSLRQIRAPTLAAKTGVTRQAYYKVLSGGAQSMDTDVAMKTAQVLGVRAEWFINGSLPMFPSPLLSDTESQLIYWYRKLDDQHQKDLRSIAQGWARESEAAPNKGDPFKKHRS